MQPWAKTFYFSPAWRSCRAVYIKSVGGLCERCLKRGLYVPGKIVHHKRHLTPENVTDPTVTLAPENLELVCRDCHAAEHATVPKRYRIDEAGHVVTSPPSPR